MARNELNQTDLAAHLGLTTRQVRNLESHGLPHRSEGNRKWYPVPDAIQWYVEWKRQEVLREVRDQSYAQARAREKAAKARLAELELAREEGRLVPKDVLDETVGEILDRVRSEVLNMPGRWAPQTVGLENVRASEAVWRKAVREVLEELVAGADDVEFGVGDELPADFPGRSQLEDAEVTTYSELMDVEDFQSIHGIGPKTAKKIRAALSDEGFDAAA